MLHASFPVFEFFLKIVCIRPEDFHLDFGKILLQHLSQNFGLFRLSSMVCIKVRYHVSLMAKAGPRRKLDALWMALGP